MDEGLIECFSNMCFNTIDNKLSFGLDRGLIHIGWDNVFFRAIVQGIYALLGGEWMKNIRLKMALHPQQLQDRMKHNPEMVELHISEDNLYHPEEVVKYIQEFKSKGVSVYLHHPSRYKGSVLGYY